MKTRFATALTILSLIALGCSAPVEEDSSASDSAVVDDGDAPKSRAALQEILGQPSRLSGAAGEIATVKGARGTWHVYPWAGAEASPLALDAMQQYLAVGEDHNAIFLFGSDGVAGAVGDDGDLAEAARDFGGGALAGATGKQSLRPLGLADAAVVEVTVLVKLAAQAFGKGAVQVASVAVKTEEAGAVAAAAKAATQAVSESGGVKAAVADATSQGASVLEKMGAKAKVAARLGKVKAKPADLAAFGITDDALQKVASEVPGTVAIGGEEVQRLLGKAGWKVDCDESLLAAWRALPDTPSKGTVMGGLGDRVEGYRNLAVNSPGPAWYLTFDTTDDVALVRSIPDTLWNYADEIVARPWQGGVLDAKSVYGSPGGFDLYGGLVASAKQLQSGHLPRLTLFKGTLTTADIEATLAKLIADVNDVYVSSGVKLTREMLKIRIVPGGV